MRKVLKVVAILVGTLVGVAVLTGVVLGLIGRSRLSRTYEVPGLAALPIAQASAERGERLAHLEGCVACHGAGLAGQIFLDIPPARVVASNLTAGSGGVGEAYEPADWDRAVRYGVRPNGKLILPFMPYHLYNGLRDEDAADLVAYLERLPPADNDVGATVVRVPGYVMFGLSDPSPDLEELQRPRPPGPEPGPTAAYGAYLASVTCVECHGADLRGGKHPAPQGPAAPGLANAGTWPLEDFRRALRTGVLPGGRRLTDWMPVDAFRYFTDDELAALHAHLGRLSDTSSAGGD